MLDFRICEERLDIFNHHIADNLNLCKLVYILNISHDGDLPILSFKWLQTQFVNGWKSILPYRARAKWEDNLTKLTQVFMLLDHRPQSSLNICTCALVLAIHMYQTPCNIQDLSSYVYVQTQQCYSNKI